MLILKKVWRQNVYNCRQTIQREAEGRVKAYPNFISIVGSKRKEIKPKF
jgi:hypothetical protein